MVLILIAIQTKKYHYWQQFKIFMVRKSLVEGISDLFKNGTMYLLFLALFFIAPLIERYNSLAAYPFSAGNLKLNENIKEIIQMNINEF